MLSKCGWTPLDGMTTDYKVDATIVNGRVAYSSIDGVEAHDEALGLPLRFNPVRR